VHSSCRELGSAVTNKQHEFRASNTKSEASDWRLTNQTCETKLSVAATLDLFWGAHINQNRIHSASIIHSNTETSFSATQPHAAQDHN